jgi:hypothetical protein
MFEHTPETAAPLFAWMAERHAIYLRKEALQERRIPKLSDYGNGFWGAGEWNLNRLTADPILHQFRFCNVYRELDRVTVWIRQHIREPFADHPDLWFMLAAARWINWPPTLEYLIDNVQYNGAWPTDERLFTLDYMVSSLLEWRRRGNKVFTGAYLITNNGVKMPKEEYVVHRVLGPLWKERDNIRPLMDHGLESMQRFHVWLSGGAWNGFGSFMAGQVTTDLRHTRYLKSVSDRQTWAAIGPGSARGLNRLAGRPVDARIGQVQALAEMRAIQSFMYHWGAPWLDFVELTDLQNCCCEYDKYERVRLGQGRPRALYVPGRGY